LDAGLKDHKLLYCHYAKFIVRGIMGGQRLNFNWRGLGRTAFYYNFIFKENALWKREIGIW